MQIVNNTSTQFVIDSMRLDNQDIIIPPNTTIHISEIGLVADAATIIHNLFAPALLVVSGNETAVPSAAHDLLTDVLAPVTGAAVDFVTEGSSQAVKAVQVTVVGTGALTAVIVIESTNKVSGVWEVLKTFSLSGSTSVTDGEVFTNTYRFLRARLVSITGTGATVNSSVGV